jgi:hypothetical protein
MIALKFSAPTGTYSLQCEEVEDAAVEVGQGDVSMVWRVEVADGDGVLQGLTRDTEAVWGDVFWRKLILGPPATIEYWGEGVLVRTDKEVT